MPTTYPYGPKGAPVVGNGLGGLPRRLEPPSAPAVVVPPTPVGPYYLGTMGQMYNTEQTYCYSPYVTSAFSFSDGYYSNNTYYLIKSGTYQYCEFTYAQHNRQIKTTGGNATTWQISNTPDGYVKWVYCMKNDASGMVRLETSGYVTTRRENTACVETINGVDTYYFMTWDNSSTMVLSKVTPNYATQQVQQAADAQLSYVYGGGGAGRRPQAIFVDGDFLYVLATASNGNNYVNLDKFNKSNLTFVSSVRWSLSGTPQAPGQNGFYAETATTIAIRYQDPSSAFARVFVLDKATQKGYDYYNGIGGDSSWQANLICSGDEIYLSYGAGSGGGYGFAYVYALRSTSIIGVATQTYSGATFSLASSVRCTTPKGFIWGSYFRADGVGGQSTNLKQVFVPGPGKTFSYSNNGWNFYQQWDEYATTPVSGTVDSYTPPTTSNPYTAQFWSFNPLGTTYITL